MASAESPLVGVIMGSKSDWEYMAAAAEVMSELKVPHELRVLSAHRTPDLTLEYAANAAARCSSGSRRGRTSSACVSAVSTTRASSAPRPTSLSKARRPGTM